MWEAYILVAYSAYIVAYSAYIVAYSAYIVAYGAYIGKSVMRRCIEPLSMGAELTTNKLGSWYVISIINIINGIHFYLAWLTTTS